MVDGRSLGDILCCDFGTNVGIFVYIELTNPNGKTGRGSKWTCEINLSEGVKLKFCPRMDGVGYKFGNRRHCVLQERGCEAGKRPSGYE